MGRVQVEQVQVEAGLGSGRTKNQILRSHAILSNIKGTKVHHNQRPGICLHRVCLTLVLQC